MALGAALGLIGGIGGGLLGQRGAKKAAHRKYEMYVFLAWDELCKTPYVRRQGPSEAETIQSTLTKYMVAGPSGSGDQSSAVRTNVGQTSYKCNIKGGPEMPLAAQESHKKSSTRASHSVRKDGE